MQNGEIPERFDPRRMARESAEFHGVLPTGAMNRLASAVLSLGESAGINARFSTQDNGRPLLEGEASVAVTLRCQRCLEPMTTTVQAPFRLAVVVSEADAERLPEELDAVIVEGDSIETSALVEDELILALPLVGRHENMDDCGIERRHLESSPAGVEHAVDSEEKDNPFAALESLKRDRDD
ncbi:DUF177 domain-containing protein [Ectothiorhodospiraceae bacterium WFHF3C12]|nr:DUF177 domain-containing protein [Ectothiorhodospiraceae bacterium WFHF3C12]